MLLNKTISVIILGGCIIYAIAYNEYLLGYPQKKWNPLLIKPVETLSIPWQAEKINPSEKFIQQKWDLNEKALHIYPTKTGMVNRVVLGKILGRDTREDELRLIMLYKIEIQIREE